MNTENANYIVDFKSVFVSEDQDSISTYHTFVPGLSVQGVASESYDTIDTVNRYT